MPIAETTKTAARGSPAPSLFTGVKLAVTYSVIGVIAGEFILSVAGLGRRIKFAYDSLDNPATYALQLFVLTATILVYFFVHGWTIPVECGTPYLVWLRP